MPVELFHPDLDTTYPGVIVYMDAFGIREELRDMCRRFATAGYAVFLPNMYYREGGPSFAPPRNKGDRPSAEAQRLNRATTVAMSLKDTGALLRHAAGLDVSIPAWATVGYCMGGRHAIAAAVEHSDPIKAALSIHGGAMINDTALSCDRLIARSRAEIYLAFARNDPSCPDDHKRRLETALTAPGVTGRAEHYDAEHGWTFTDRHCFDKQAAERVWENAFHIFRTRLWDNARTV